jgi:hypothetical protein
MEWYNKNYVCCYNNEDVFTKEENNILTENDKTFVRDVLYRQDLLNIFNLENFEDEIILSSVSRIFELVKNEQTIQTLINSINEEEDSLLMFMTLFSFENLHKIHPLISVFV